LFRQKMTKFSMWALFASGAMADDTLIHPPQVVPGGWEISNENADTSGNLEVLVGLKRNNMSKFQAEFEKMTTPGNKAYLNYLSWEEMGNLVRPNEDAIGAVIGALAANGGADIRVAPHGDYVKASVPMRKLETLTSGQFQTFINPESGRKLVRQVGGIRLPAKLAKHVDTFTGLHGFPLDPTPASVNDQSGDVTPAVIEQTYGITSVSKSGKKNIQAIGQFQGQYVSPTDLSKFCQTYDSGADCTIDKFVGKNTASKPGIESMLDTEYIEGLGKGVSTWVYSYPSFDFCSDLLTWANDVAGESEHPYVVSLSYGSQKIDFCDSTTIKRLSEDVQKLAGMGITTVIASGDDGSGGTTRQGSNNGKLSPSFPASIPYALAVGSTFFETGLSGEEQATTQFGSGGGFSYDYTMPSYQADAVNAYLAKSPQIGSKKYASGGRASPDVSLLGEKFAVEDGGRVLAVGGTSASTPSWGAIISLLNDDCLSASDGSKTLGFVNPLLYKNADAFTDITKGTNAIGSNSGNGWKATAGWDAATGLGTPNFAKLQTVVKAACGGSPVVNV
jgi:tripeptidyl-peptidase-1